VPFICERATTLAGIAQLARVFALVGEVALYGVVKDPLSAPMAIIGSLLGAGALSRDEDSIAIMAAKRDEMNASDIANMRTLLEEQSATIRNIVRSCGE